MKRESDKAAEGSAWRVRCLSAAEVVVVKVVYKSHSEANTVVEIA